MGSISTTLTDSIRCAWQSVVDAVRSIGGADEGPHQT